MSDDEESTLPPEDVMSPLFKGLQFFLLPNNRSGITEIRRKVAREHSAIVNGKFNAQKTTHILVDQKLIPHEYQVARKLEAEGIVKINVPVLSQNWLVQSVQSNKLLDYKDFLIDLDKKRSVSAEPEPALKKTKLTKIEKMEENINRIGIVTDNPNAETIRLLKQMSDERKIQGDAFRVKAYKSAIDSLSKTDVYIKDAYQAVQLPGIGKSIAEKIEEIVKTHRLKDLETLQKDDEMKTLKLFKGIYSVGNVAAHKWMKEGLTTLEEVAERDDLTINQRIGLEFYDDWNERIPRKECTVHNEYLSDLMKDIDPDVEFTIGGSYRRGAKTCGDIDFIVTKPNAEIEELRVILTKLLDKIKETGYHRCSLSYNLSSKWFGGCSLPPEYNQRATGLKVQGKCRRIDFLLVPWRERGAAFIYFTGNDDLNKLLRLLAKKKNMSLNETGLFHRDDNDQKTELVESFDERKIFEILGVKWREPTEREIGSYDPI